MCVYGGGPGKGVKSWGDCVELAARRMGDHSKEKNKKKK